MSHQCSPRQWPPEFAEKMAKAIEDRQHWVGRIIWMDWRAAQGLPPKPCRIGEAQ